ncbi:interleukin-27 subunit beta [Amia ocellicauda]|uniref:interleukin-27 subunit beta n=1 Tax=Amia ocellicauda TaxID=2972642 RepID=UPI003464B9DA
MHSWGSMHGVCVCAVILLLQGALAGESESLDSGAPHVNQVLCWSPKYPVAVLCAWSLQPEPLQPTSVTATYRLGLSGKKMTCKVGPGPLPGPLPITAPGPLAGLLSGWCEIEHLELFVLQTYIVSVSVENHTGQYSFILEHIVKPDPPLKVVVTPGSRRQLSVKWAPPPSWPDPTLFPLKYRVQYTQEGHAPRTLGPYERCEVVLRGLRPRSSYSIRVSAQDFLDNGHPSDWSLPISAHTT